MLLLPKRSLKVCRYIPKVKSECWREVGFLFGGLKREWRMGQCEMGELEVWAVGLSM